MDAEVKKLENEIKEVFLIEKLRMARQGIYDHIDRLEDYCYELFGLMSWLGPHITKRSDQGSTLQIVECTKLITTMEDGDSLQTMLEDGMEPHMGGATTELVVGRIFLVL